MAKDTEIGALDPTQVNELMVAFSRQTTIELYRSSVWAALMNRSFEQDLANARSLVIQDPKFATSVKARTRGSDWGTAQGITADQITLTLDQAYEVGPIKIAYEDIRQSPRIGWLDRARRDGALKTATYIDDNVTAFVAGLAYAADDKYTVGSGTTNTLTIAYPYYKGTGYTLVAESLRRGALHWYRKNAIDAPSVGGAAGRVFAIMSPELYSVLLYDMEQRNLHWDQLTDATFDMRLRSMVPWTGRLYGIDVIVSNAFAVPGSGKDWKFYMGTRQALALAIDQPVSSYFPPERNPDGPSHQMNEAGLFGRQLINKVLLTEVTIATEDSVDVGGDDPVPAAKKAPAKKAPAKKAPAAAA